MADPFAPTMSGTQLRLWRKARHLTQLEVGLLLGMASNTVARMERDELRITEWTVAKLHRDGNVYEHYGRAFLIERRAAVEYELEMIDEMLARPVEPPPPSPPSRTQAARAISRAV